MNTIILKIPSINCGHCVMTIKRESGAVEGVEFVSGDPVAKTVTFKVANEQALKQLKAALAEVGYPVQD